MKNAVAAFIIVQFLSQIEGSNITSDNTTVTPPINVTHINKQGCNCNTTVIELTGIGISHGRSVQSPSYPLHYPNHCDCKWWIHAPCGYNQTTIMIEFLAFETEQYSDVLTISSSSSRSTDGYTVGSCSGDSCSTAAVENHWMVLHFIYNQGITYKGFSAKVWATESIECGSHPPIALRFADDIHHIQSPGYPIGYPNNCASTWIVSAPYNYGVRVRFLAFDTESGYDYLTITDGAPSSAPVLERCDGAYCPEVTSTWRFLGLSFQSDGATTRTGFTGYVTAVPIDPPIVPTPTPWIPPYEPADHESTGTTLLITFVVVIGCLLWWLAVCVGRQRRLVTSQRPTAGTAQRGFTARYSNTTVLQPPPYQSQYSGPPPSYEEIVIVNSEDPGNQSHENGAFDDNSEPPPFVEVDLKNWSSPTGTNGQESGSMDTPTPSATDTATTDTGPDCCCHATTTVNCTDYNVLLLIDSAVPSNVTRHFDKMKSRLAEYILPELLKQSPTSQYAVESYGPNTTFYRHLSPLLANLSQALEVLKETVANVSAQTNAEETNISHALSGIKFERNFRKQRSIHATDMIIVVLHQDSRLSDFNQYAETFNNLKHQEATVLLLFLGEQSSVTSSPPMPTNTTRFSTNFTNSTSHASTNSNVTSSTLPSSTTTSTPLATTTITLTSSATSISTDNTTANLSTPTSANTSSTSTLTTSFTIPSIIISSASIYSEPTQKSSTPGKSSSMSPKPTITFIPTSLSITSSVNSTSSNTPSSLSSSSPKLSPANGTSQSSTFPLSTTTNSALSTPTNESSSQPNTNSTATSPSKYTTSYTTPSTSTQSTLPTPTTTSRWSSSSSTSSTTLSSATMPIRSSGIAPYIAGSSALFFLFCLFCVWVGRRGGFRCRPTVSAGTMTTRDLVYDVPREVIYDVPPCACAEQDSLPSASAPNTPPPPPPLMQRLRFGFVNRLLMPAYWNGRESAESPDVELASRGSSGYGVLLRDSSHPV